MALVAPEVHILAVKARGRCARLGKVGSMAVYPGFDLAWTDVHRAKALPALGLQRIPDQQARSLGGPGQDIRSPAAACPTTDP